MMSLFLYPRVLMAVDEKKVETIAKQIAQQRTPQVCTSSALKIDR